MHYICHRSAAGIEKNLNWSGQRPAEGLRIPIGHLPARALGGIGKASSHRPGHSYIIPARIGDYMSKRLRKYLLLVAKLAIAAALLAWVFRDMNWQMVQVTRVADTLARFIPCRRYSMQRICTVP